MVRRRFDFVETSPRISEISFFFIENLVISEKAWYAKGYMPPRMKNYFFENWYG